MAEAKLAERPVAATGAEVLTIDRVEAVELGSPRTPGFDLLRRGARHHPRHVFQAVELV